MRRGSLMGWAAVVLGTGCAIAACSGGDSNGGGSGGSGEGGSGAGTTSSTTTSTSTTTTSTSTSTTTSSSGGGEGGAGGGTGGAGGSGGAGGGGAPGTCSDPLVAADPSVVNGDTTGQASAYIGSCQQGAAPEVVYAVTAAATGPMTFQLASTADLGLHVRTDCTDPATEIECVDAAIGGDLETLVVDATQGQTLFVIVDGYDVGEESAFTLAVNPAEVCDDTSDNDADGLYDCEDPGCSADAACPLAMECAAATAAQASNDGDTTNGTSHFAGSCTGGSLAKEAIFSYMPAQTGTLTLTLQSAADLGLYVRSTCDDDKTELACIDSQIGGTDEVLDVPVTQGVGITIFVDGYTAAQLGPFTLLTSFAP